MSIYIELEGSDDVVQNTFKAESGKTDVSLTIASVAGKRRTFKLTGLANEITLVKVAQMQGKSDSFPEAREAGSAELAQVAQQELTRS